LSSHIISKTPPFNPSKQQEFENMKRQLQVSKGIGGIHTTQDAGDNIISYNSKNGYSPGIPSQKPGLDSMTGTGGLNHNTFSKNGPVKAM